MLHGDKLVIAGAPQGDRADLLVDDPRPLGAAAALFERRCRCVVTYEDARWRADQVQDLPGAAPGRAAPKIPAGRAFMFGIRRDIATQPTRGAVLDTTISLPPARRSLFETVRAIADAAAASSGARIVIGTVPTNFMLQTPVTVEATNEPARDVLVRTFAATGGTLSWRLLNDFGMQGYALNVHFVP